MVDLCEFFVFVFVVWSLYESHELNEQNLSYIYILWVKMRVFTIIVYNV